MNDIVRFGVSVEKETLQLLDDFVVANAFPNRSQAVRHLIQHGVVRDQWDSDEVVGGSLTLVYDHHRRDLLGQLTRIQHDYHNVILCSQHIHLDHHNCMEIIAMKGRASVLRTLANRLIAVKGVIHGDFSMTKVS